MNKPKNPKTQPPHHPPHSPLSSGVQAQTQTQSSPQPHSGNLGDRYRFGYDKVDVSSKDDFVPIHDLGPDCEEIQDQENDGEHVYTRTYPHPVDSMTEDEYKEYVRREVLKGVESAERGELIPHEEVFKKIRDLIESKKNNKKATTTTRMP